MEVKNISRANLSKIYPMYYAGSSLYLKIFSHISRKWLIYDRYHQEYEIYKSNTGRKNKCNL